MAAVGPTPEHCRRGDADRILAIKPQTAFGSPRSHASTTARTISTFSCDIARAVSRAGRFEKWAVQGSNL